MIVVVRLELQKYQSALKYNRQFVDIEACIEEHCHSTGFTVATLCQYQNISRVTLHRVLKKYTGQSTSQYINTLRLKKAFEILSNGGLSVKEVAHKVGYADPKYFSKIFKHKFGRTPTEVSSR